MGKEARASGNDTSPVKHSDVLMIVSLEIVLLVPLLYFAVIKPAFNNRMRSISLDENRFVMTEWHLLQTIKSQTEAQLREKDQEIANLQRRYEQISERNNVGEEL